MEFSGDVGIPAGALVGLELDMPLPQTVSTSAYLQGELVEADLERSRRTRWRPPAKAPSKS
jgi:hypothetical protein